MLSTRQLAAWRSLTSLSLRADGASRPCAYEDVWRKRIKAVREAVLPLAVAKVAERLRIATETAAYLADLSAR